MGFISNPSLTFVSAVQEMAALLNQVRASTVNVEVDAKPQADMGAVMAEIRAQYEAIVEKNRREMENWYKGKVRRRRLGEGVSCKNIGLLNRLNISFFSYL